MAGRGPAPKAQHQRERDTRRRQADAIAVERDGRLRGPTLAKATGRADWPDEVRAWWEDWRHAPQAVLFEATDWRRLAQLAVLLEGYHRRPSAAAMSEIRINEERLGALFVDRQRAKIHVSDGSPTAEVVPLHAVTTDGVRARLRGDA